jgi:hypothetical protein
MKAKYFFPILSFVLFALPVKSAWFGPDNYEECTFKKLKECDGDGRCARAAYNLCDKEFPYKLGKWKQIKWDDYTNSEGKIQIADTDFQTKLCFTNKRLNLEKECSTWEYSYEVSTIRIQMFEIAKTSNDFKKFLNNTQTGYLEGTTYFAYRAERKRIEK